MNKEEKDLRIVFKKFNKRARVMNIKNTLEEKQRLIGGLIEAVTITDDISIICDKERKSKHLFPNLIFDFGYITGDCFFVGNDYESENFKSLTKEQIKEIKEYCEENSFVKHIDLKKLYGKELEK